MFSNLSVGGDSGSDALFPSFVSPAADADSSGNNNNSSSGPGSGRHAPSRTSSNLSTSSLLSDGIAPPVSLRRRMKQASSVLDSDVSHSHGQQQQHKMSAAAASTANPFLQSVLRMREKESQSAAALFASPTAGGVRPRSPEDPFEVADSPIATNLSTMHSARRVREAAARIPAPSPSPAHHASSSSSSSSKKKKKKSKKKSKKSKKKSKKHQKSNGDDDDEEEEEEDVYVDDVDDKHVDDDDYHGVGLTQHTQRHDLSQMHFRAAHHRQRPPDDALAHTTAVTVFGFPASKTAMIVNRFQKYGEIVRRIDGHGNWMFIEYKHTVSVERALSQDGKVIEHSIMIGVHRVDESVLDNAGRADFDKSSFIGAASSAASGMLGSFFGGAAGRVSSALSSTMASSSSTRGGGGGPSRSMNYGPGAGARMGESMSFNTSSYRRNGLNNIYKRVDAPRSRPSMCSRIMEYIFSW